ncbi:MAG TPA: hypothetical protein VM260_03040 [Pirellula sp.]|nr:hypothetical protein [Pirellula sp.]
MQLFRYVLVFLMTFAVISSLNGCSGRPSSELTKEQLEKQRAEDALSLADEDRLEAELKKKARKK